MLAEPLLDAGGILAEPLAGFTLPLIYFLNSLSFQHSQQKKQL
jgi:hypothetical protein